MPRIICQHTGVEFDAASRRQKNHPRVSELLDEANDNGTYQVVKQRLTEAREQGLTDIDQIITFARTGAREALDAQAARRHQAREEQAARDERRRQTWAARERVNAILRPAGYRWSKSVLTEEDLDAFSPNAFTDLYGTASQLTGWTLLDPTGQATTVRRAMKTLAASGNTSAQAWLDDHPPQQEPNHA